MSAKILFAIFVSVHSLAFATDIADPAKFVSDVYKKYMANAHYEAPSDIYTPRLKRLFDEDRRKANGEVGCVDFDFWLNGQDFSIRKQPDVTGKSSSPGRQTAIATFVNIRTPMEIQFDFVRIDGKWLLDDVHSLKGERWTLSKLLSCWP